MSCSSWCCGSYSATLRVGTLQTEDKTMQLESQRHSCCSSLVRLNVVWIKYTERVTSPWSWFSMQQTSPRLSLTVTSVFETGSIFHVYLLYWCCRLRTSNDIDICNQQSEQRSRSTLWLIVLVCQPPRCTYFLDHYYSFQCSGHRNQLCFWCNGA